MLWCEIGDIFSLDFAIDLFGELIKPVWVAATLSANCGGELDV